MANEINALRGKWTIANRYSNFGAVIRSVRVDGFRGIGGLSIEFGSPITAFSGLNGAGKSTVGQLAVCAYKRPSTAAKYKRYYVKDFFPVSVADPIPFDPNARVEFSYETTLPTSPQAVTISRAAKEWSGYKRQPEGYAFYVGFTLYIPKVERRDLSVYRGSSIELRAARTIPEAVRQRVAEVLNQPYEDLLFQGIGHKDRDAELGMAKKYGRTYSENNMGFGEGRVLYMIDQMERAPEQSLFVLEEPETSLHEEAQFRLARYLLDVCNRRHHQIVLSTHSSVFLEALPAESRQLLFRDAMGVSVYPGISSTRAKAILSGGRERSLTVCVEDEFAKLLAMEIVRRGDSALLKAIRVEPLGAKEAVVQGVRLLQRLSRPTIGLRDGDVGADPASSLFSLPGGKAPEKAVFESAAVAAALKADFDIDLAGFMASNGGVDSHRLPSALAEHRELPTDALSLAAVRAYVADLPSADVDLIVSEIRKRA